ncbi:hypothetical protein FOL46_009872 [Perkinsus olseni]|uniref:Uncharacterized protein n=1 Tax=Perkinsus olseni TaxID=32597 RepID=A0A7J6L0G0_PEROL|nr:hypothetical protein FOL46_009872 [Perkinsus olseni]
MVVRDGVPYLHGIYYTPINSAHLVQKAYSKNGLGDNGKMIEIVHGERLGDTAKQVNIGDKVYLRTPSPIKLGALARGPYIVEEIRGQTYFLRELSTNKEMQQPLYKLITTQ